MGITNQLEKLVDFFPKGTVLVEGFNPFHMRPLGMDGLGKHRCFLFQAEECGTAHLGKFGQRFVDSVRLQKKPPLHVLPGT